MKTTEQLLELISTEINSCQYGDKPKELYDPIRYIMALGGKRMRPLLTTMAYSLYKDDVKNILPQAVAVEVFHNFTLLHDDIMDEAPLRRGKPTVHERWNGSTAILSGDVMLVKAYEMLVTENHELTVKILQIFNQCAIQVCEGQQQDMLFEQRKEVKEEEYLDMIHQKTAALLGLSLELGGLLAQAEPEDCKHLKEFGTNIGIGFQLKDDLLDVYADKEKFGKQVGGDILSNKKTFPLIQAMAKAKGKEKKSLNDWLIKQDFNPNEKINAITNIYDHLNIKGLTETKMNEYFEKAFKALKKVNAPLYRKVVLKNFCESLIDREK